MTAPGVFRIRKEYFDKELADKNIVMCNKVRIIFEKHLKDSVFSAFAKGYRECEVDNDLDDDW